MADAPDYSFDGWALKSATGELVRGGETQRLTKQPLTILIELLDHAGDVVTRERLVELLWPKGVVDFDNGLNVAVRRLRIALGDETGTPRYIETLPRLGYRFVGKLDPRAASHVTTPAPAATAFPPPGAAVAASSRARRIHPAIVGALIVSASIAGALFWSPWRKPVPSPRTDAIAPTAQKPIVARRTTSVRAYELYLQGTYNRSRRDRNGLLLAIEQFEAAIREDPAYSEAWSGLADALTGAAIGHMIPAHEAFERSRRAALRAVELDPGIAESHTALAQIYMFYDRDYAKAEAEYEKAFAANGAYARLWHHFGSLRAFQGRGEEALAAMRRARELEPMTLLFNANYGLVLYHMRRHDEAIAHLQPLIESMPSLDHARSVLIRALVAKGQPELAVAHLALRQQEFPNISDKGLVLAHLGRKDEALREIERIRELSAKGFGVGYEITVVYAALGDVAKGCEALELAWRDASPFLGWMTMDPRLDPLRKAPCFGEVQRRLLRNVSR